ncbi:Nucleotidyltransferase domain-containing protein [Halopseudomonas litoralis]|uniref:Nucleotidyltransferase domain-containing protein n=1 Tax=Halopseudomonas litoralis TaxID=797277 RepID=A0A1H1S621_9GAMM|nr:nucleotidyltransferase domain-containing protein [Halopseudomonas litoralis]SDS43196.1 Nucleotidyltransferase domain-containing protein [Halopseudomonas litoralis]
MTSKLYGLPAYAVERLCELFSQWPQIEAVVLYGSRAKGNFRPGSDIDLTIQGKTLDLSALLAIENQIDDLLLPWSVDLSLLHLIDNASLVEHIERVGVPFYSQT